MVRSAHLLQAEVSALSSSKAGKASLLKEGVSHFCKPEGTGTPGGAKHRVGGAGRPGRAAGSDGGEQYRLCCGNKTFRAQRLYAHPACLSWISCSLAPFILAWGLLHVRDRPGGSGKEGEVPTHSLKALSSCCIENKHGHTLR